MAECRYRLNNTVPPYKQENTEYHSSDFGVFVVSFPILISGKENKKNIRKI
jgi:hypothetical protein